MPGTARSPSSWTSAPRPTPLTVPAAASRIDGFPDETLLNLEHAILAHHGKKEYGAPILPQTVEALLVSFIDDLDAKMNIAARHRLQCNTSGEFTDKVYALDNRR